MSATLPLIPAHLDELRRSGLNDETIAENGIRSESDPAIVSAILQRRYPKKCGAALVFFYREPTGELNGYKRVKPSNPRTDRNGKAIKYESPKGLPNRAYFPPGVIPHVREPTSELLLTEGEKNALKATQEGFPCVGLVGVHGWMVAGKTDTLIPDLAAIEWRGRQVRIVFDSDSETNRDVRDAESRLAAVLKPLGAVVKVVRLPDTDDGEKMGVDDYLVRHDAVAFRKLLDAAVDPDPVDLGAAKQRLGEVDPMVIARDFINDACKYKHDHSDVLIVRHWRGESWRWSEGAYRQLPADELRAAFIKYADRTTKHITTRAVANVLACVQAETILPASREMPSWLSPAPAGFDSPLDVLAARNGLFHLPSLVVGSEPAKVAPTPQFFAANVLDVDIRMNARQPEQWLHFLNQLWPDASDCITTLQEWFGYCLTPDTRQQKILLPIGPRRSGKGTIGRVLRAVVGAANVAGPTLAGLGTNFGLWPLLGKAVALVSDARLSGRTDAAVVTERLLSISGEDALTIDRKNLAPVTTKLSTRFIILTNELPRLSDSSGALSGRMLVLPLTRSFYGNEDHELTDRLLTELPGIVRWAIEGWGRLHERGHFVQPETGKAMLGELEDIASPISMFVRECCTLDPVAITPVSDLFAKWKEWCELIGKREPGTEPLFGRDLMAAFPCLRRTQPRDGERRYRAYVGISINPPF